MHTEHPVLVEQGGRLRHITPREGEALLGLPDNYTAMQGRGDDATPVAGIHRLSRIGGGIDLRSVQSLISRITAHQGAPASSKEATDIHIGDDVTGVAHHVKPHTGWNTQAIAEWTTPGCLPGGIEDYGTWRREWHMRGADELVR